MKLRVLRFVSQTSTTNSITIIHQQSLNKEPTSLTSFSLFNWRLYYLHSTSTSESTLTRTVFTVVSTTEGRLALSGELLVITVTAIGTAGSLLVCGGNNLGRKGKVSTKVLNSLRGEVAVVVLPGEGDADVSLGLERLHEVQHLEVGGSLDLGVSRRDGVLLDDANSLTEEVREDSDAVGLGDEHGWSLVGDMTLWSYYR